MKVNRIDGEVHDMYVEYRAELCQYVMKSVGVGKAEAEDVVQAAFAKVSQLDLETIRNGRAFLYKTCRNIAVDVQRRSQVRQKHVDSFVDTDGGIDQLAPERIVDGRRDLKIVSQVLWQMPQKRRRILIMSRFDGLSYAEIARRENLSETVVRKHVSKALRDFQRAMQDGKIEANVDSL